MSLTNDEVKKVAKLARINYEDNELTAIGEQFNTILDFIDKLSNLELDEVEPFTHPSQAENNFREDIIVQESNLSGIFEQTLETENGFLRVPKMLSGGDENNA